MIFETIKKLELLSILLTMVTIDIALLILGIRMMKRKVVIVKRNFMAWLVCLYFLPYVIFTVPCVFIAGFDPGIDWMGPFFVLTLVLVILIAKKFAGSLLLINIEEDTLYETIRRVLKTRNVVFEEKRGRILLPSLSLEIKLNCHSSSKSATMDFVSRGANKFDKDILNDLIHNLTEKGFNKFPVFGLVYIVSSVYLFLVAALFIEFGLRCIDMCIALYVLMFALAVVLVVLMKVGSYFLRLICKSNQTGNF